MSDNAAAQGHLPECDATECGCADGEECGPACRHLCICPALRACEARVREEFDQQALFVDAKAWGYRLGREDEREAAAQRVAQVVPNKGAFDTLQRCLAAARGEQQWVR